MKIVILDGHVANPGDISWSPILELGDVDIYPRTTDAELIDRSREADIVVVNKRVLDNDALSNLPNLKCICTLATGYNNIDVEYANKKNILVCNAIGYSTASVAQHVFSLIFSFTNQIDPHNASVQSGQWSRSIDWCYTLNSLTELSGKNMSIYGYGTIGQAVGNIARAMGMNVLVLKRGADKDIHENVENVDMDTLFSAADVLTLHAPLTADNEHIVNGKTLSLMKPTAILINTGRGGLIDEKALRKALELGTIKGAGLDVLSSEPPPEDHVLLGLSNCIITPHIAWATPESRNRLIHKVAKNIKAFQEGNPINVVNG